MTRTLRSPTNARSRSRRQYDATHRTNVASRDVESPRTSSWTQCPTDVEHAFPHHSQRSAAASCSPACQPGLRSTRASKATPVIVVPAGASNRQPAAAPGAARPGRITLRTYSPSPATPRAASIPPGHDAYATTPGADLNGRHEAFSAPKHAVTSYVPADAEGGGSRARTATASVRIEIGRRMPPIGTRARELAP